MKRNGNGNAERQKNAKDVRIEAPRGEEGDMSPLHIFSFFWLAMMHFGVFWAIVYKAYMIKVEKQFCVPIYWLVMCPPKKIFPFLSGNGTFWLLVSVLV